MKLKAIASLICLFFLVNASAQEDAYSVTDLHPASPTAFQFMKYTEMPVSEYTGIPEISVPLYEINVDGVKLPVNLTYHSRGINVTQEASWVGLGWDLQMGSLIQTINDRDDYGYDNVLQGPYMKQLPDYFPSNGDGSPQLLPMYTFLPNLDQPGPGYTNPYPVNQAQAMQGFAVASDYYIPVQGVFNVQRTELFTSRDWDSEPDFFVASFPEGPIKFILDFVNSGRLAVLNKYGYNVYKTSAGFRIVAPTGNNYYFETVSHIVNNTSGTSMEGNFGPWQLGGDTVSHIFFLSRIVTKNKKLISFNYANTASSYDGYPVESQKLQSLALLGPTEYDNLPPGFGTYAYWDDAPGNQWLGSGTYSTTSFNVEQYFYLQSIVFPTGRLDFYLSGRSDINGGEKLDSVRISNLSGTPVKTWQLDYSYFNSASVGGNGYGDTNGGTLSSNPLSTSRLELLDVKERGPGGAVYTFGYNSTMLPKKNSYAVDYWGYYNGALTNTSLVPDPTAVNMSSLGDNGNNKNANASYAQACILQSIQYPTGGKTTFEYELNQLVTDQMPGLTWSSNTIQGGGLRIHAINHLNSDGRQATRSVYSYGAGRQINFMPVLTQCPYTLLNELEDPVIVNNYTLTQISVNGVFGTNPMASIDGVGYDMVTRQDVDSFGNTNGTTVTTYYNTVDVHNPSIYSRIKSCSIPTVRSIASPENGSVATVTRYDNKGNMVEDISNTYQLTPSMVYYGARILPYHSLYYWSLNGTEFPPIPQNVVGYYPIYDVQTLLNQTADTVFYANGPMSTWTLYGYDAFYNQLISKTTNRSDGGTDLTTYSYPFSPTSNSPMFTIMVDSNRLTDIVTLQKLTNSSILKYQYDRSFEQIGSQIVESKAVIQNNPIPSGSPNFPDSVTYDVYDPTNANILQYTSKGVTNAAIWDYGRNFIVADVKNAAYSQVAYCSFEADGTGNWVFTGTATADATAPTGSMCYNLGQSNGSIVSPALNSGTTYVVSYWVKGGGPLTIPGTLTGFPVQGKTIQGWTYYEHKVTGQSALTISGSTYIDELRLYPATAQMITYTVTPLVGMTSECDVANRIVYYFYDNLGRLSYVKDQDGNIVKTYQYHYQGQ